MVQVEGRGQVRFSLASCAAANRTLSRRPSHPLPPRRGSDTVLPFECPSDFIFNIPYFDDNAVPYRLPNFLEMPQAGSQRTAQPRLCSPAL